MEINVNIQTTTENHQSTNDNHNYDNRRSYNNLPLNPGECLVPIHVDWEMVKHFNMCQDNLETWHIGPNKVLVAFAPVKIADKPAALKQFNSDVREHFCILLRQMMFSPLTSLWMKLHQKMAKASSLHHQKIWKKQLCFV